MNALVSTTGPRELSVAAQQQIAQIAQQSRVNADMSGDIQGMPRNTIKLQPNMLWLTQNGTVVSQGMSAIDVVIVGVSKHTQRAWYRQAFHADQDAKRPDCRSRDGVTPDNDCDPNMMPRVWDVDPATGQIRVDATGQGIARSVRACAECPMNQKDQSGYKPCASLKWAACVLPNDVGGTVYALKVGAKSIFGEGDAQYGKTFQEYSNFLNTRNATWPNGIPISLVVTRVAMKPDSVAVTRYNAVDWLPEDQWNTAISRENDPAVLAITEGINNATASATPPALLAPAAPVVAAPTVVTPVMPQMVQQAPAMPAPPMSTAVPPPSVAQMAAPAAPPAAPAQPLHVAALSNPMVPDAVRQWAATPGVTPDMVMGWLQQNMPQVLVPVTPPAAPVTMQPPPAAPVMAAPQQAPVAAQAPQPPAPPSMPAAAPPPPSRPTAAPSPYAQTAPQGSAQPFPMHQGQIAPELQAQLQTLTAAFDS